MFDRRQFFGGLNQAAYGQQPQAMPPAPGANWLTGAPGFQPQGFQRPGGPAMMPMDQSALQRAADQFRQGATAFGGHGSPAPGFAPPAYHPLRRMNPALDAAVASQHASAVPSNPTPVPGTTPATATVAPTLDPPVAPPVTPEAPPAAPAPAAPTAPVAAPVPTAAPIAPPVESLQQGDEFGGARPRADGAPGPAPADWVNSGGFFYPTSIAPWLAQYQHQLTAAQTPPPIATAALPAPTLPAAPVPPPVAAPAPVAAPVTPAVQSPAVTAPVAPAPQATPPTPVAPTVPPATDWGAYYDKWAAGQAGNPNSQLPTDPAQAAARRAQFISSQSDPQYQAAAAQRNQETNAYQIARDAALGQMLPGSVGANGTDYGKPLPDPSAALRAFVASGYTGQQALADGWGKGVGAPGWQSTPPGQQINPNGGNTAAPSPPSTSYLPPAPAAPATTPAAPPAAGHPRPIPPPDSNRPPQGLPGSQFRPVHSWMAPGLKPAGY